MKSIKVNKHNILDILNENRTKHIKKFEETYDGYLVDVLQWFTEQLKNLKEGNKFEISFPGQKPKSYEKDYNRVINMLKLSIEDEVELDTAEYYQYVEDNWTWKDNFNIMNSTYSKV